MVGVVGREVGVGCRRWEWGRRCGSFDIIGATFSFSPFFLTLVFNDPVVYPHTPCNVLR